MYARVTPIRFPPSVRTEVIGAAQGLVRVLREHQGFKNLDVLTDAEAGEGLIISYWETEADAEASEANSSYILLHSADEHDVQLPPRATDPEDLRSGRPRLTPGHPRALLANG